MSQNIYKSFFFDVDGLGEQKEQPKTKNRKWQTLYQQKLLRNTKNTQQKQIKYDNKKITISKKDKSTMCRKKKKKRYISKTWLLLSWLSYFTPHERTYKIKNILAVVFNVLIKQRLVKISLFFLNFLSFIDQLYQKKSSVVSISNSIRKLLLRKPRTRLKTC